MVGYIALRIFIELFRFVPFTVLYFFSDILRFIFFYVIKYRKEIAFDNLRKAFPEKTKKELKKIAWASYRNLTDIMLESFKGMVISKKQMLKRFKVINGDVCDYYAAKGQSAIYLTGHYANWEWAITISEHTKHQIITIFKPLKNKRLNVYMKKKRERFGMTLVAMENTRKAFDDAKESVGLFLGADQSPSSLKQAIWVDFFNRDTPCIHGPEAYAKKFYIPLIFAEFQRVKRGFYTVEFSHFIAEPNKCVSGEITQMYMSRLEKVIRQKPEDWIWTHKRWKHKRVDGKIIRDYYYKK